MHGNQSLRVENNTDLSKVKLKKFSNDTTRLPRKVDGIQMIQQLLNHRVYMQNPTKEGIIYHTLFHINKLRMTRNYST